MTFEKEMRAALDGFVVECRDLIQEMEDSLLGMEVESDPTEMVNALFRAVHTIKGSAGLFGLDQLVAFTHVVEGVLDRLREGQIQVSSELIGALLPCCDHTGDLLDQVGAGDPAEDGDLAARGGALLAGLAPYLGTDTATAAGSDTATAAGSAAGAHTATDAGADPAEEGDVDDSAGSAVSPDAFGGQEQTGRREKNPLYVGDCGAACVALLLNGQDDEVNWHLSLRFSADTLRDGMDPIPCIRYLSTLGDVIHLTAITDSLPALSELDPETCYLGFEVGYRSSASRAEIEDAFEFFREGGQIRLLPYGSKIEEFVALIQALPEEDARIGDILVRSGAVGRQDLEAALRVQAECREGRDGDAAPVPRLGEILVDQRAVHQPVVEAALQKQRQAAEARQRDSDTIRVDASRLDRLIDTVGELVIAGASASLRSSGSGDVMLVESVGEVMRLVEEVRDSALQLRMVPIGTTFGRFQRMVRDVSAALGKDIALVINGGETEVDKALVERIGDPLTHLVRNSLDHGIEPVETRLERGKSARGTVHLNAYHDSGSIVIEVTDDGGGLDARVLFAKAVERGLVDANAALTDQEIFELVFEPGFSTAEQVSDLSGRGVGMDVVKRNVTALRGTITAESELGRGTTMRIRLPLTLAIIDGFGVGVGKASYIVPLDYVVECVELPPGKDSGNYMSLRGEVLPFIRLRTMFGAEGEQARRQSVVVVEHAGVRVGLVVDTLLGELQTVIKPLGRLFGHVQGIGGSTILGNGEVALIVDVPMLVQHLGDREQADQVQDLDAVECVGV